MKKFRSTANAFSIGAKGTAVLNIPKSIQEELGIDTATKKSFFDIYTDYSNNKKLIIFEFKQHAEKEKVKECQK